MSEHLNEAVLHAFLAALAVEAVLRLWPVRSAAVRLACRLLAFAEPLVLLPLFELLAPFRHAAWFADGPALFATSHLAVFTVLGVGLDRLLPWPAGGLGLLLLARDLGPLLTRKTLPPGSAAADPKVTAEVAQLASVAGVAAPTAERLDSAAPLLLCVGARRTRLLVSQGLVELLDGDELRGALAHELAHVRHRDVLLGWVLLAGRVVQAFNPVAQVVGRLVALETELRADADAARWTGRPAALASALLKVSGGAAAAGSVSGVWLADRLSVARAQALEARCRLLLAAPSAPGEEAGPASVALFAVGLAVVLFFVT